MVFSLEQFVRGQGWQSITSNSDNEVPKPRQVYEVKAVCHPGAWRVKARVFGTSQGIPFDYSQASMERRVAQDECDRRPQ
ncbi:hypothetical protein [Saccharopolyspora phatthalungensis]|uniref:Uncharacterized protein n=1 Tax=Saccharopolyspora phatthalungensis TaxID=664693 RepID=A0A840QF12_9PSEU|nr:hypothetical protein [Saccharopolyspora phatthalungensis]MBB5159414.1 hypothetical protein [Saccharopolyspora phatthalungensis]